MLGQRVVTALVLLALLLPALFAGTTWPFVLLTLAFIAAAGWEWARLNGAPGLSWATGLALAACGLLALRAGWTEDAPVGAWWAATALWVVGGAVALRGGPAAWPHLPRALRLAAGPLLAAWLAMANAKHVGLNFILSVFCLVWVADIAAYFGGRAFGRRKLAPSISPGKSWEGAWSGTAGVLLLALAWTSLDARLGVDSPSLYTRLVSLVGWIGAVPALLLLAGMSVVGDLFESLVKRAAGAKDSSRLLPGHGGVLDRIDALMPVMPIALALAWL